MILLFFHIKIRYIIFYINKISTIKRANGFKYVGKMCAGELRLCFLQFKNLHKDVQHMKIYWQTSENTNIITIEIWFISYFRECCIWQYGFVNIIYGDC